MPIDDVYLYIIINMQVCDSYYYISLIIILIKVSIKLKVENNLLLDIIIIIN